MKRLIIVGSPRTNGRSAHLAEMLFEANIDERPQDELFLVPVSEIEVGPCVGCNACRAKSGVILKDDDGNEITVQRHRCVFDDDMQTLYDLLDEVDELTVVCPVYFSGAPAPMKCVIDRLQPYFWARAELKEAGQPLPEKRPLTLHVLGEGGDPHGYDALVSEVKSSFATADFRLNSVLDWVGKIDEDGQILQEARQVDIAPMSQRAADVEPQDAHDAQQSAASAKAKNRPKLDISTGWERSVQQAQHQQRAAARKANKQGNKQGGKQQTKGAPQKSGRKQQSASGKKKGQGKRRG